MAASLTLFLQIMNFNIYRSISKMALMEKIAQCLSPTSTIPTDVRFLFNKGSSTKELKAHKLILALISDVFEREFYGSMKDGKDDIDIKDASHDVFQAMIDFIYNKHSELKVYDLTFLSQLYYLGEKYNIEDLRNRIIAAIPEFKILDENVLDVAILAEEYILHEPLMEALYKAATCFLWRKFAGQLSLVIDFFSQIEAKSGSRRPGSRRKNPTCSFHTASPDSRSPCPGKSSPARPTYTACQSQTKR